MSLLSSDGQALVTATAAQHGFSPEAVTHMLTALSQTGGQQAQFNHFEFGGMGQWSLGGMTMIGDMFNNALKARVDALCADLSGRLKNTQAFESLASGSSQGTWWPEALGQPSSTGAQNTLKYAYFPQTARLAILRDGAVTVYDTGAHQISGFGQQQGGTQSLSFTSQFGLVHVADLPLIPAEQTKVPQDEPVVADLARPPADNVRETPTVQAPSEQAMQADAIFDSLEKLGALHERGILTDAEFSAKKTELLARL